MTPHRSGSCANCEELIPFSRIFVAPLTSGKRWAVSCPHCGESNYLHAIPDLLICLCALLLSLQIAAVLWGTSDAPRTEWDSVLGFAVVMLIYIPLRATANFLYLRVGIFHTRR